MIRPDAHPWDGWTEIWEFQSDEGLERWRWDLYDLHDADSSPETCEFVKRALAELARIKRRRAVHWLLRDQLMTSRPDISGDLLVDALVEIEKMRLELGGAGGFETDFRGALEVAEARAEAVREERGGT
jgi:hypothetical protein